MTDKTPGSLAGPGDLTAAVMGQLPAINDAVTAHRTGGCPWCTPTTRGGCPVLGLAATSLDLVIRCWRSTKAVRTLACAPRDLHAAVRSRWLDAAESATLNEILGTLDLAAAQADAAGINLPTLAGIGVAIIDSYRAATTTPTR